MEIRAGECVKQTREKTGDQLLKVVSNLAEQMSDLNNRVYSRLESVSRPEVPEPVDKPETVVEEWPPLFAQIRDSLIIIQNSIYRITRSIDRLEV